MQQDTEVPGNLKFILEAYKIIRGKPDLAGIIKCPKCSGQLHYRVAKLNGHVHAKCQTENCLSWME
jgi:hypothetical protein